jgi:hypothetical protein
MDLHDWADLAVILTLGITLVGAVVGIVGYVKYRCELRSRSERLEDFLRREKMKRADDGQRSVIRIIKDVGLTEDEIIQASFRNPRIGRRVLTDPQTNLAKELLFEYQEKSQTRG